MGLAGAVALLVALAGASGADSWAAPQVKEVFSGSREWFVRVVPGTSIGETYGFAGCALVLSLYALLIWRALHILTVAKNLFGALIAGGIAVMLLFQLFVNIGMNVGIMPITGVTAPLLSFGGSSMLSTFLALGLLHSINAQARETADRKGRASVFQ